MKFLTILFLKFLFLSNLLTAEAIPTKSKILEQSSECIKDAQNQVCRDLVSEIIEAYFFKNSYNQRISLMMPYVIKNC